MRAKFLRWLLGWCMFPKCDCNLQGGEQKCMESVYDKVARRVGGRANG